MRRYAQETTVPVEKSKGEIESILARYGADNFISGWDRQRAVIGFTARNRTIRFQLELPDRESKEFCEQTHPRWGTSKPRSPDVAYRLWQQACRQRWRALALVIKAKLEAVESGITTFEDEFLAFTVLPDGQTVGQWAQPQLDRLKATGLMPRALLAPRSPPQPDGETTIEHREGGDW